MRKLLLLLLVLLPVAAHAHGGVQQLQYDAGYSFRDKAGHTFGDNYGWKSSQVVAPSNAVFMGTSQPSRFPNCCIQWTLLPTDDPLGNGSNRDEYAEMFNTSQNDENGSSGTLYYAISIWLPHTWVDPNVSMFPYFIVLQLHGNNSNPSLQPGFSLNVSSVPGRYTLTQWGGEDTAPTETITDLGPHQYDTWVDFVFEVKWANDITGYTAVWTRTGGLGSLLQQQVSATNTGTAIAPFNVPTIYSHSGTVDQLYWKQGAYRSLGESTTAVYYAGPLVRATTLRDAASGAFGQYP